MGWLWKFCGQVKVICTEFHEGVHYAKRPEHFIPIIDHLEQLHENGYVHGDIRAYNMVLKYSEPEHCFRTRMMEQLNGEMGAYNRVLDYIGCQKSDGWLIDFDYGGKIITGTDNVVENTTGNVDKINPKYPKGYVGRLDDGLRQGVAGNIITYDDDWFALGKVIFTCHELLHSNSDKASWTENFRNVRSDLKIDFPEEFESKNGNYASLDGGPAKFLRDYLQLASKHDFYFIPEYRFMMSLDECHGFGDKLRNDLKGDDSKGATGSPQKNANA